MEWTVLTISSCLLEEMSADSHRRREDPEREPVTKGRSYNPHIVLLSAPTHAPSFEFQRIYFPINSPPTTAPSPRPQLPYTGLPQVQAAESMSISTPNVNELHILKLGLNQTPDPHGPPGVYTQRAVIPLADYRPLLRRDFLF